MTKNRNNNPVLHFIKDIKTELSRLVPVDFPELYTFERMKELPRYCRALALRAERGNLNLSAAQRKMQDVLIYSQKLQQMVNGRVQPSLFDLAVVKKQSSPKDPTEPKGTGFKEMILLKEIITIDCPDEKKTMVE